MNIGILGGSFDPIHNGHIHMAVSAYQAFALDEVWLIPAGHSPNKEEAQMTAAIDRFRMCEIAAQSDVHLSASRIEIDAPEVSYTYRTLEKLTEQYPQNHFFFIMGGDSLDYFDQWRRPERICALATILVIPRDQFDTAALEETIARIGARFASDIRIVPCSQYMLSSTEIRKAFSEGREQASDLPPGVLAYIRQRHLYSSITEGANVHDRFEKDKQKAEK